jgi:hypothetical protein
MKNSNSKLVTFDLFNEIIPIPSQDFCIYVWWSKEELNNINNRLLQHRLRHKLWHRYCDINAMDSPDSWCDSC